MFRLSQTISLLRVRAELARLELDRGEWDHRRQYCDKDREACVTVCSVELQEPVLTAGESRRFISLKAPRIAQGRLSRLRFPSELHPRPVRPSDVSGASRSGASRRGQAATPPLTPSAWRGSVGTLVEPVRTGGGRGAATRKRNVAWVTAQGRCSCATCGAGSWGPGSGHGDAAPALEGCTGEAEDVAFRQRGRRGGS